MAVIKTTFKLRRGYEAKWIEVNPILEAGEPGWAIDTHTLKIGDGILRWTELPSLSGIEINPEDVEAAVFKYLEKNPIIIDTDDTLTQAGIPADAAAVREKCVFKTDTLILCGGDADDEI
jgi:hypothetical protein